MVAFTLLLWIAPKLISMWHLVYHLIILMGSYWDIYYCVYELWWKNTNDYPVTNEVDGVWNTEYLNALASWIKEKANIIIEKHFKDVWLCALCNWWLYLAKFDVFEWSQDKQFFRVASWYHEFSPICWKLWPLSCDFSKLQISMSL